MPITITFISLKKRGGAFNVKNVTPQKKERGGAFNANNAKP